MLKPQYISVTYTNLRALVMTSMVFDCVHLQHKLSTSKVNIANVNDHFKSIISFNSQTNKVVYID